MKSKGQGGLGFRDLHSFNLAILFETSLEIVTGSGELMREGITSFFFPEGDILKAKPIVGMSCVWRSLLHGVNLLREGII